MKIARKIELLAPAKNIETGKQAIIHGADAVYIGIDGYSARSAAGNSVEDIAELVKFAHLFNTRIYVTLNTILYDDELHEVEMLIWQLYKARVDAIIIQDMGILQLNLPPIPLHASTQADNRTVEKVRFLEETGFTQVVLARELSFKEIAEIADNTTVALEVFIHGALCVSYSGQCYLSQAISGRSANRGKCAQLCRLPYDLVDSNGKLIERDKYLLSLKDFNQYHNLENLLDAGVSSLKIEGRLKDVSYVKNTVAAYRKKLDEIFARRNEYTRASSGNNYVDFDPNLSKSFNRGFTDYFSNGRQSGIESPLSPKSIGEYLGTVKSIGKRNIIINTKKEINNGDGLCYTSENGLDGFRVNSVEGNTVFPAKMPNLNIGTKIYKNYDHEFEQTLLKNTAERKISAKINLFEVSFGFALQITDEDGNEATIVETFEKNPANKSPYENIRLQLSKTGNTIVEVKEVIINFSQDWFIPSSALTDWRKKLIDRLLSARKISYKQEIKKIEPTSHAFPQKELTYLHNISNKNSRAFYTQHQSKILQPAFEIVPRQDEPLMFTKYCIKFAMGYCSKTDKSKTTPFKEPLYLVNNNVRLKLQFDCKECQMLVIKDSDKTK